MLSNRLAPATSRTFAKHCKSLHTLQKHPDTRTLATALAGGRFAPKFFCKIFMIQNVQAGAV
ncbi:hypothetical protein EGO53_03415 [Serratia liquefaciens]|uniref:Uncharacterized protein n=1 Tax=Serratia liquefaciens TaxID=614 RepID=A0A515CRZ0_SERLI|nr:hypothetical protein EGO53_03415 [Serratia liquefaciens]